MLMKHPGHWVRLHVDEILISGHESESTLDPFKSLVFKIQKLPNSKLFMLMLMTFIMSINNFNSEVR